jgi:hypothetical protein
LRDLSGPRQLTGGSRGPGPKPAAPELRLGAPRGRAQAPASGRGRAMALADPGPGAKPTCGPARTPRAVQPEPWLVRFEVSKGLLGSKAEKVAAYRLFCSKRAHVKATTKRNEAPATGRTASVSNSNLKHPVCARRLANFVFTMRHGIQADVQTRPLPLASR